MTTSIDVDTFEHRNPIPAAARVGPMVWSSLVPPVEGSEKVVPDGLVSQTHAVLRNMAAVLDASGLQWHHVGKIDFWLRDAGERGGLNEAWLDTFSDETSRPARQVHDGSKSIPNGPVEVVATFQAYDGAGSGAGEVS